MSFNRGHFFSALAGGVIAVMLVAVLPAGADNGDPIYLGQANIAKATTRVSVNYGMVIRSFRAGVPAATFKVSSGAPIAVNSTGWVENLNADLLDGMEASAFARVEDVSPFVLALPPGFTTWPAYLSDLSLEWQCLSDGTAHLIWHHSPGGDWYLGGVLQVSDNVEIVDIAYGQKVILGVDVPLSSLTATTSSYTMIMLAPGGVFSNGPGYVGATCLGHGIVFTQDSG